MSPCLQICVVALRKLFCGSKRFSTLVPPPSTYPASILCGSLPGKASHHTHRL